MVAWTDDRASTTIALHIMPLPGSQHLNSLSVAVPWRAQRPMGGQPSDGVATRQHRAMVAALLVAGLLGAAGVLAAPSLCTPAQTALFSCSVGAQTLSVCGSKDLSATVGSVQYRFGRSKPPPWAYPAEGADWRVLTHGGTWAWSGGGGAWMAFDNPPYRYNVYTAIGQGWAAKAGVVVERNGRRIAHRRCTGAATSDLGPALFERTGLADEGDAFSLP